MRVQPRASRTRVVGVQGGVLKLQVTAAPVDGKANQAVVALLADWLGVPPRTVAVVRGATARDKLVEVTSPDPQGLAAAIGARVDIQKGAD